MGRDRTDQDEEPRKEEKGLERSKLPARRAQCSTLPTEGRVATFSGLLWKSEMVDSYCT